MFLMYDHFDGGSTNFYTSRVKATEEIFFLRKDELASPIKMERIEQNGVNWMASFEKKHADFGRAVEAAAGVLKMEGIAAFPTDTLHGMLARLNSAAALHENRQRPFSKPFIIVFSRETQVENLVDLNSLEENKTEFMCKRWPGRTSLVFQKRATAIYPTGKTVCLRMINSAHAPALYVLLENLNEPLLAPSLNFPGLPPVNRFEDLTGELAAMLDFIYFDRDLKNTAASEVYDLSGDEIRKFR